jgi:YD repeat-containing protein
MKSIFLAVFPVLLSLMASGQFYYKDIIGTKENNQLIQSYRNNKIRHVSGTGFDGDGNRNSDFFETHDLYPERNMLKISTGNKQVITNQYYRFDNQGRVTAITDTSSGVISTTSYDYDANNNLVSLRNLVSDQSDSINENEEHQWFYDAQGRPARMLRIMNKYDTTDVRFTLDAAGNVIEELPFKNKLSREKIYYYYDDNNRMTDIVRYNFKAGRLLPDYMFEYSSTNQVIQKVTTLSTMGLGYFIWRYVYDDKGLKIKEATFNRDKVMTGKIEYLYAN